MFGYQRIDPIYTVSTGSLFILKAVKQELCEGEGLLFIVKDYDRVGGNDELGHVQVSGKVLCEANGERMALPLEPAKGSKQEDAGKLNIRCRPATNYDKKFLEYAAGNMKGDFLGINQRMDIIMNPSGGERSLIKQKVSMMGKSNFLDYSLIFVGGKNRSLSFSFPLSLCISRRGREKGKLAVLFVFAVTLKPTRIVLNIESIACCSIVSDLGQIPKDLPKHNSFLKKKSKPRLSVHPANG